LEGYHSEGQCEYHKVEQIELFDLLLLLQCTHHECRCEEQCEDMGEEHEWFHGQTFVVDLTSMMSPWMSHTNAMLMRCSMLSACA